MMIDLCTRKKYYVHSNGLKKNCNFAITNIVKIVVATSLRCQRYEKYDKIKRKYQ